MTTIAAAQVVEIYLDSPDGVRIALLDQVLSYDYALLENEPGPFNIRLPHNFDRNSIDIDYIIEIWRGIAGSPLYMDYCGFIEIIVFGDENGIPYTDISGFSTMGLLKRRIALDNGATVNTTLTDHADDMLKAIFKDQFGTDAIAYRDLSAVAGGVTIQLDNAAATSMTKEFKHKNVYDVMLEIALTSKDAGTRLYFDVEPVIGSITTGNLGLIFKTYINQRGSDRTFTSNNPVYIGPDWENLINGKLIYDHSNEINYVTVLGKGEGATQETASRSDATRIAKSIWNRREGIKNATNAAYIFGGDNAALNAEGDAFLEENKPKITFTGDIQETQSFRYGYNWFFGDRVTVQYYNIGKNASISKVFVSKSTGPEVVTARMEVDE